VPRLNWFADPARVFVRPGSSGNFPSAAVCTFHARGGQLRPHLWAPPPHIATPRARHRSEARPPSAPRTGPIQCSAITWQALTYVCFGEARGRRLPSLLAPKSGSVSS